MKKWIPKILDHLSNFFVLRKGLLPMMGILLITLNFIVRLWFPGWLNSSDLFLHLGIIIAIFGFMLAWAL